MNILNDVEIAKLNGVLQLIERNAAFEKVMDLAAQLAETTDLKNFPYIYAGFVYAASGRLNEAVKSFEKAPKDIFANIVKNYIQKNNAFKPATTVFKKAFPFTAWTKTSFMTEYFKKHLEAISAFAKKYPPDSAEVSILDIGTGNGILISKVINHILEEYRIDKINLILLDPSKDMLSVSEKHCRDNIKTKLNISKICCKSQDMTEDAVKTIHEYLPLWFTHCSLSIHHMPCEVKIEFLKKMKKLSQHFIIGDVNWNHDVPEKNSPELIYSVYKSYGLVFQNVMDGDLTEDDIEGAIDNFLLSEAINIIKNDKESRIDYHTTIDEWVKIARQAGFSNPVVRAGVEANGFVHSFLMELT